MPAPVVVFCGWNTRLAPARKPRTSTPLISVIASTTTIAVPMNSATSSWRCQRRMKNRAIVLMRSMSTRAAETHTPVDEHGDDQGAQVADGGRALHAHHRRHLALPGRRRDQHQQTRRRGERDGGGLAPVQHPLRRRPPTPASQHEAAHHLSGEHADPVADGRVEPADQTLEQPVARQQRRASATGRRTARRTRSRRSRGAPGSTPTPVADGVACARASRQPVRR